MITFYPGPSKVYPNIGTYMQEAFTDGVLSINHRSPQCMALTQSVITAIHQKLNVPAQYSIYFISSATEAWEIIAQSLTKHESIHYYNGDFGKKWAEYAKRLLPAVKTIKFDVNALPTFDNAVDENAEMVCITQNETSNGTQLRDLTVFRQQYPNALLAMDVTSSLGGISLDWDSGDIWFASVQKCLGLPAGMALMICSPKALEKARIINDRNYYNSLLFIDENFQKFQTHYTPNVLNIYLLNKVLAEVENISIIDKRIKQQATDWYNFFNKFDAIGLTYITQHAEIQSDTIIALEGSQAHIEAVKQQAKQAGIVLGNGYGNWKNTTIRIANFPAITQNEIDFLRQTLQQTYGT